MCTTLAFEQTSIFLSRKVDCACYIVLDFERITLAFILPAVPSLSDGDRRDFHGDKECMLLHNFYNPTIHMVSYTNFFRYLELCFFPNIYFFVIVKPLTEHTNLLSNAFIWCWEGIKFN